MQPNRKAVLPIILVFIFINTFLLTGRSFFEKQNIDREVLIASNAILFISNFITLPYT